MAKNNCHSIDKQNENQEIILSNTEYNQILDIQQQILEMTASHNQISQILSKLCSLAESLLPNSVASIMLKNKGGLSPPLNLFFYYKFTFRCI